MGPTTPGEGTDSTTLTLKAHDVYDNGVVHLCYGPADGTQTDGE